MHSIVVVAVISHACSLRKATMGMHKLKCDAIIQIKQWEFTYVPDLPAKWETHMDNQKGCL